MHQELLAELEQRLAREVLAQRSALALLAGSVAPAAPRPAEGAASVAQLAVQRVAAAVRLPAEPVAREQPQAAVSERPQAEALQDAAVVRQPEAQRAAVAQRPAAQVVQAEQPQAPVQPSELAWAVLWDQGLQRPAARLAPSP